MPVFGMGAAAAQVAGTPALRGAAPQAPAPELHSASHQQTAEALNCKSEPRTASREEKNTPITGFMQDAASHILGTKRESKWLEAREQWRRAESELFSLLLILKCRALLHLAQFPRPISNPGDKSEAEGLYGHL